MKLTKRTVLGLASATVLNAVFGLVVVANAGGGDPFQPVWVDSLKVQADGTKGRTAHREIPISAGPDRVFLPDTIRFREESRSGGGRIEAAFLRKQYKFRKVPMTIAGVTYNVEMPYEIRIALHAETGSGPKNYGRGAWLNGYVEAETIEVDR